MMIPTDRSDLDGPQRRDPAPRRDRAALLSDASAIRARSEALIARGQRTALDAMEVRQRAADSVSSIRMARLGRAIDDIAADVVDGVAELAPTDWLVLEPPAELDGPEAEDFCRSATQARRDLLLDMRGVRLLSARGARSLYGLVRAAAAAGHTVAACDPIPLIQLVMDVTALTAALPVIPRPERSADAGPV